MAAYAAHLTRTVRGAPAVFRVCAQDALAATGKPALRTLLQYLATVYPGRLAWCLRWYDEVYLILDCLLQHHYLKNYAASFSETFYGLQRVATASSEFSHNERLPSSLERSSLAMLVLVPYLQDKLLRYSERWRQDDEDGKLGQDGGARVRRAAYRVYSAVHTCWELSRLVQLARFLMGGVKSHRPELAALGLLLRDAPAPDLHGSTPLSGRLLRVVEYGAFLVQFLRWWEAAPRPDLHLPAPASPRKEESMSRYTNKCPVCLQRWKTPTVLPVSGLVFCYVCIVREVRHSGRCPVTKLPAHERSLTRLYLD